MEDRSIVNSQITASSHNDGTLNNYKPHLARLNNEDRDYWETAEPDPSNPWIQVDFLNNVELYGIQTQGFYYPGDLFFPKVREWVTMLQVQTGDSEDSLTFIEDTNGNPKVTITECYIVIDFHFYQKCKRKKNSGYAAFNVQ